MPAGRGDAAAFRTAARATARSPMAVARRDAALPASQAPAGRTPATGPGRRAATMTPLATEAAPATNPRQARLCAARDHAGQDSVAAGVDRGYGGEGGYSPGYGAGRTVGRGGYDGPTLQGDDRGPPGGMSRRGLGPENYSRSDERIREDVNERLCDDDHVDASGIEVEVSQGVVTLGTVGARWEKYSAEDIADACSGVLDVQNRIRVATVHRDGAVPVGRSALRLRG